MSALKESFTFHVSQMNTRMEFDLTFNTSTYDTKLIDLVATDLLTNNSSLLDSLMPFSVKSVNIAIVTPMPIIGVGNVSLSSTLFVLCFTCIRSHK